MNIQHSKYCFFFLFFFLFSPPRRLAASPKLIMVLVQLRESNAAKSSALQITVELYTFVLFTLKIAS